jgi:pullulanase/glycogen debranching enzyme
MKFNYTVEPVYSNTTRDQGNVSDCTGCQNQSNSTHQGTREMCLIVQDVRTSLIQHTKGPGKCV